MSVTEMNSWVLAHLKDLRKKRVLVVGDIGLDVYIMGDVRRLSPEAPVPILDVTGEDHRLGLSANVALNLQSLGGQAELLSVVGEDQSAQDIKKLFSAAGMDQVQFVVDGKRPTTKKMRLLSGQHHIARVDFEKLNPLTSDVQARVLEAAQQIMASVDIVILQDYGKGVVSLELSQSLIKEAKNHGKRIIVDPYKTTPLEYYKGAYLMTPNHQESVTLAKQKNIQLSDDLSQVETIGETLMAAIESEQMVVTLGSAGMKLFESGSSQQLPTFAQSVFDVTGAGDTVIAAIGLALAAGWSLPQACHFANLAAGVVVAQVGCVPCDVDRLSAFVESAFS